MSADGLVCPRCRTPMTYRVTNGLAYEDCSCGYRNVIARRAPSAEEKAELERQKAKRITARRARARTPEERYVA